MDPATLAIAIKTALLLAAAVAPAVVVGRKAEEAQQQAQRAQQEVRRGVHAIRTTSRTTWRCLHQFEGGQRIPLRARPLTVSPLRHAWRRRRARARRRTRSYRRRTHRSRRHGRGRRTRLHKRARHRCTEAWPSPSDDTVVAPCTPIPPRAACFCFPSMIRARPACVQTKADALERQNRRLVLLTGAAAIAALGGMLAYHAWRAWQRRCDCQRPKSNIQTTQAPAHVC